MKLYFFETIDILNITFYLCITTSTLNKKTTTAKLSIFNTKLAKLKFIFYKITKLFEMKKLLLIMKQNFLGYAFVFSILTLIIVSCQKKEDDTLNNPTNVVSSNQAANRSSSSSWENHTELVYTHLKNFQSTVPIGNYTSSQQSRQYFNNSFVSDVENLKQNYPTLESLLSHYVQENIISNEAKIRWVSIDNQNQEFLRQPNLNFTTIEAHLQTKISEVENSNLTSKEKDNILYSLYAMKGFYKYHFENEALQQTARPREGNPCEKGTWPCILEFGYYTAAGVKLGSVFPGAGNAVGGFIGAIYGAYKMSKCIEKLQKECDEFLQQEKCKGASNLSLKIEGCGLTQKIVATGYGSGISDFIWNNANANPSVNITTTPFQIVTQIDPNKPVTVALNTNCDGEGSKIKIQPFDIAKAVNSVGNVRITGPNIVCRGETECFTAFGSTFNNPNNSISFTADPALNVVSQNGDICVTFPNQVGTYSISVTVTNACTGATDSHTLQIKVKENGCQL